MKYVNGLKIAGGDVIYVDLFCAMDNNMVSVDKFAMTFDTLKLLRDQFEMAVTHIEQQKEQQKKAN